MKDKLDRYLDEIKNLPPTPTILIQLIALFRQPDRDVDEVISLLSRDPSLTAEVLRRCNSSFFGGEEPVTDIGEAVFRVGFHEVYRLSVTIFGRQAVQGSRSLAGFEVEELWQHCAATAVVAGVIARRTGASEGLAYTTGLLHDVGKIVFASAEGVRYAGLIRECGTKGLALSHAEHETFGFCHGEVGARLLNRWGVPEDIVQPVRYHHQTDWTGPHGRLAALITLANVVTHALSDDTLESLPAKEPAKSALEFFKIEPDRFSNLVEEIYMDLERLGAALARTATAAQ